MEVQFVRFFHQAVGILLLKKFVLQVSTKFDVISVSGTVLSEATELAFWDILDPFRIVAALNV